MSRSRENATELAGRTVRCELCPKFCEIAPGQSGDCRVRINLDGDLKAVVHSHPVSIHVDPMEKKPLYHFLPASPIFSLATAGCNLHCINCQNWQISQANPEEIESYQLSPEQIVTLAEREGCESIAYTYTEPLVYYEYTYDISRIAHERGLRNVLVTAGFLNPEPLREIYAVVDAANIDLKAMSNDFYRRICGAELRPVLTALELALELGVWLELTNLIIPTLNDSPEMLTDLTRWVVTNLGPDVPIHFSAFTPRYRLQNLPRTPDETLLMAREIALAEGLRYVYIGNVMTEEGRNTVCPHDDTMLIERIGFHVRTNRVGASGLCPTCGEAVPGVWE